MNQPMTDRLRRNPRMMSSEVTYPFLDVRESIPGRCYVLNGEEIVPIEAPVPDWWWIYDERDIRISFGLQGGGVLWTVFTCVANEDGSLFETVYVLWPLERVVERTHSVAEAREAHARWLDILTPASERTLKPPPEERQGD